MSAGCVHRKASVILAGGFFLGSLAFGSGIEYIVGALAGVMLTPDLDVDHGYIGNQIIRNKFGSLAEKAWSLLWYFYRGSIKHGSPLSHAPIISTLGRIAYLHLFTLVIPYVLLAMVVPGAWSIGSELAWWNSRIAEHFRILLGLMGSDLIHWALDVATTEHKGRRATQIFGLPLASSRCK